MNVVKCHNKNKYRATIHSKYYKLLNLKKYIK